LRDCGGGDGAGGAAAAAIVVCCLAVSAALSVYSEVSSDTMLPFERLRCCELLAITSLSTEKIYGAVIERFGTATCVLLSSWCYY
jgi:hypothetical protein